MTVISRVVLRLATAAAVACAILQSALALDYPTKPVRLIVGVAPGGANDTVARMVAQTLSERLGQTVVVENRPGAGGNIGLEAAANAPPDGYTLLFATSANALSVAFYDKASVNFARDITPVTSLVRGPLIMEVNPSFPAKTIPEFIAYAKANPGSINMASAGIGNTTHVAGELFMMLTGTKFTHVPYRGGAPAVTDLISGQVQVYFDGVSGSLDHVRSGRLRALGVTRGVPNPPASFAPYSFPLANTSVAASPQSLWPPNGKMVPVSVGVSVADNCSSSCRIVGVTGNDGSSSADWQVTGALTLNLRADRSGGAKSGRTYTVTLQCTDDANMTSTKTVAVVVPHDQGK
jgi:tripartite-type tricarboxylate transporter receptor subunit TctC